jgi:hypothetical protein
VSVTETVLVVKARDSYIYSNQKNQKFIANFPIADFQFQLAIGNQKSAMSSVLVKEVSLHLPFAEVELSLGAATQAFSVGAPVAREGPAELSMPATKHSRHQVGDSPRKR